MTSQTRSAPRTGETGPLPAANGDRVVALLRAHIPLSLLIDLIDNDPHSRELYANERVTPS
ncbi:MAG: hypothetical protein ABR549_18975 [Mycobacteriales bacterium]